MEIIDKALEEGRETLSEYESKIILASYQITVTGMPSFLILTLRVDVF